METHIIGTFVNGTTGGNLKIENRHSPLHDHDRGNMNITGTWSSRYDGNRPPTGAVYYKETWSSVDENGNNWPSCVYGLDASRNWSGRTSSFGKAIPDDYLPPYLTVSIWKRIS